MYYISSLHANKANDILIYFFYNSHDQWNLPDQWNPCNQWNLCNPNSFTVAILLKQKSNSCQCSLTACNCFYGSYIEICAKYYKCVFSQTFDWYIGWQVLDSVFPFKIMVDCPSLQKIETINLCCHVTHAITSLFMKIIAATLCQLTPDTNRREDKFGEGPWAKQKHTMSFTSCKCRLQQPVS